MAEKEPEEMDLKDLVYTKLEKTAFIRNMRAQLRAHIYNMLESGETADPKSDSAPVTKFLTSDNGRLALCLVEDLLEKLELRYSRVTLKSESGFKAEKTTLEMKTALGLPLDEATETPLLLELLNKIRPEAGKSDPTITLDTNHSQDESSVINETVSNSYNSI